MKLVVPLEKLDLKEIYVGKGNTFKKYDLFNILMESLENRLKQFKVDQFAQKQIWLKVIEELKSS